MYPGWQVDRTGHCALGVVDATFTVEFTQEPGGFFFFSIEEINRVTFASWIPNLVTDGGRECLNFDLSILYVG